MTRHKLLPLVLMASLISALISFGAFAAERDEQALRALVPRIVEAWGTLDISKVEPYYATDADFAYFDIAPLKYNNWKEYREGAQKVLF